MAAGVEYPEPTPATVKRLYASAFRCAYPVCARPLYRVDDETGEYILNSRIAHIHARRQGGPRWIDMPPEDNQAFDNLVLLCIEHSYEVDERAGAFPGGTMRAWKRAQLDEYEQLRRSWPITDEEAARVLDASEASKTLHAEAVIEAVRRAEGFALAARRLRQSPHAHAEAWQRLRERTRGSFLAWDAETGERLYAEPAEAEVRPLRTALMQSLADVATDLTSRAEAIQAELAAARATRPALAPWCEAVARAAEGVLNASNRWPASKDLSDDDQLESALSLFAKAIEAMAGAWRGEPGAPPEAPALIEEAPAEDPVADHRALLDQARPFQRVLHRAYDPELRAQVAEATELAAQIPPAASFMAVDLTATSKLAVAVAGSADVAELMRLIEQDRLRTPMCAAILLLDATRSRSATRGVDEVAEAAREAMVALCSEADWSVAETWAGNMVYGGAMFWAVAHATSSDQVCETLAGALQRNPAIWPVLIEACAGWAEERDSRDFTTLMGFSRGYTQVPPWLPVEAVRAAAGGEQATRPATDVDVEALLTEIIASIPTTSVQGEPTNTAATGVEE